jgi:hypothetical protein
MLSLRDQRRALRDEQRAAIKAAVAQANAISAEARSIRRLRADSVALRCFEAQSDGSWICRRDTTVTETSGYEIYVACGQVFRSGQAFAGYDDFAAYLASAAAGLQQRSIPLSEM